MTFYGEKMTQEEGLKMLNVLYKQKLLAVQADGDNDVIEKMICYIAERTEWFAAKGEF